MKGFLLLPCRSSARLFLWTILLLGVLSSSETIAEGVVASGPRAQDPPPAAEQHGHTARRLAETTSASSAQHRIAFLLPYASKSLSTSISYLTAFCTGAAGAASVADFFLLHTGVLEDWHEEHQESTSRPAICPPNVYFIHVNGHEGMADYLLKVLDRKEVNADFLPDLKSVLASFVKVQPYGLVEFKPALGHIFQNVLEEYGPYSHWGYTDLDVVFGDLQRWMSEDEWKDFDIVTYGFGDQSRLYLRGQYTIHRNDQTVINQLWRGCEYLSDMDERFRQVMQRETRYQTESAEGCYSQVILQQQDIRVKYAVKAWTDTFDDDTVHSHGVFLSRKEQQDEGGQSVQQVLYKQSKRSSAASLQNGTSLLVTASELDPSWFVNHKLYQDTTQPLQRAVGPREVVEMEFESDCMYWVHAKYQKHLCLKQEIRGDETVYWINGQLFKERYENVHLGVETAPFFHFQEWKRSYRSSQLSTLYHESLVSTHVLTGAGAIPLIASSSSTSSGINNGDTTKKTKRTFDESVSPLGLTDMRQWHGVNKDARDQLPREYYCILSEMNQFQTQSSCSGVISWRHNATTEILSGAPGWTNVDIASDVTLTMTLQIASPQAKSPQALHVILDLVEENIRRWDGQPCVVVIFVAGASMAVVDYLNERFVGPPFSHALITAIYEETEVVISRKALMNMAMDVVPTRWFLSGLELERGLLLSAETVMVSRQTASAYVTSLQGHVFVIPQFGLPKRPLDGEPADEDPTRLEHLLSAHEAETLRAPLQWEERCEDQDNTDWLGDLEAYWWERTLGLVSSSSRKLGASGSLAQKAAKLTQLELDIMGLLHPMRNHTLAAADESPILLLDHKGPYNGIHSREIFRHVDELGGFRCYNALQLAQLITIGYRLDVLAGAYAASTPASRKTANAGLKEPQLRGESRCHGCFMFEQHMFIVESIIDKEVARAAQTAILWEETLGHKQDSSSY